MSSASGITGRGTHLRLALPFFVVAAIAIVAAGFLAAALTQQPMRQGIWLVAFLILVVGVAQVLLGAGRVWLSGKAVTRQGMLVECLVYNLANAMVIGGALSSWVALVLAGTVLFVLLLLRFLVASLGCTAGRWLWLYRLFLLLLAGSASIGLGLSAIQAVT